MTKHTILILTAVIASAGLATAQHGMGRAGGQMPRTAGVAQRPAHEPSTKGARMPAAQHAKTAAAQLERNPALAARIQPLLPAGTTAEQASAGFKNWGQFVAALHVSKSLGIPFADLRSRLTQPESLSMGKAVHQLRPDLSEEQVRAGVRNAEREAKRVKQEASQVSGPVQPHS